MKRLKAGADPSAAGFPLRGTDEEKKRLGPDKFEPGGATGGGEVGASGLMSWIARAGGQKVTIRTAERGSGALVPPDPKKFRGAEIFLQPRRRRTG